MREQRPPIYLTMAHPVINWTRGPYIMESTLIWFSYILYTKVLLPLMFHEDFFVKFMWGFNPSRQMLNQTMQGSYFYTILNRIFFVFHIYIIFRYKCKCNIHDFMVNVGRFGMEISNVQTYILLFFMLCGIFYETYRDETTGKRIDDYLSES